MKDFKEAAEKHCVKYSIADFESAQAKTDFIYGCEHGYSEAMKEYREFYLLVREYFSEIAYLSSHAKETPERALRLQECQQYTKIILQRLQGFTDHEQSELPFKD